jgi:hypothetical protein
MNALDELFPKVLHRAFERYESHAPQLIQDADTLLATVRAADDCP